MNSKQKRERARLLRSIPQDAYKTLTEWARTAAPGEEVRWRYVKRDGSHIEHVLTREQIQRMEPVK